MNITNGLIHYLWKIKIQNYNKHILMNNVQKKILTNARGHSSTPLDLELSQTNITSKVPTTHLQGYFHSETLQNNLKSKPSKNFFSGTPPPRNALAFSPPTPPVRPPSAALPIASPIFPIFRSFFKSVSIIVHNNVQQRNINSLLFK